jgi:trehalose 6-phosphate synthase
MIQTGKAPLIVASNRGPLTIHAGLDGDDEVSRGSGGLVSGMQSALAMTPDALWVCAALNDRERAVARQTGGRISELQMVSDALQGDFDVQMLPIDASTFRGAYDGIANSTLWFVLHRLFDLSQTPSFDASWRRQWAAYVRYNQAFARSLAAEAAPGGAVMVQDYHLFLVPGLLRELRPDVQIGHFTHTPWVDAEYLTMLPDDVCRALLESLASADVIGLHTERWVQLFRESAQAVLGRDLDTVQAFPLGTDEGELTKLAARRDVASASRVLAGVVGDRLVIGRVDRTELSKNVVRGLLAYRELLRTRPEWRGRVVHAVYDNPSREDLPAYREYTATIERLGAAIDDEFGTEDWSPVLVEIVDDYPAALAVLLRSDVVLINSVRDGMNLVVLEALTMSERSPAIVLSRDTGAAEVLGEDALLVNPFDVSATAQALHQALLMEEGERAERAGRMRQAAVRLPPTEWFSAQLAALPRSGERSPRPQTQR